MKHQGCPKCGCRYFKSKPASSQWEDESVECRNCRYSVEHDIVSGADELSGFNALKNLVVTEAEYAQAMQGKPLVAEQHMKEFDPECERHLPLLIVKAVNPGCTLELQIENAVTGKVVRLTSGESSSHDMDCFVSALVSQFKDAWRLLRKDADVGILDLRNRLWGEINEYADYSSFESAQEAVDKALDELLALVWALGWQKTSIL